MQDPDLMNRAQRAAAELERAWHRWQSGQGPRSAPMLDLASYVGYSQTEPRGEPRVVLGVTARAAELLADLLEQRVQTPLPVPPQSPPVRAEQSGLRADAKGRPSESGGGSASRSGAAPRPIASPTEAAEATDADKAARTAAATESARGIRPLSRPAARQGAGPLAMAASAARLEAETRIRAAARSSQAGADGEQQADGDAEASHQPEAHQPEALSEDQTELASVWGGPAFRRGHEDRTALLRLRRRLEAAFGDSAETGSVAGFADDRRVVQVGAESRRVKATRGHQVQRLPRVKRQGALPGT